MMDEFINSFIDEARELLSQLERDLLILEKTPGDREIMDNIFRIMHNLKGAARMYGFEEMQDLAHGFENIFDQIRTGDLQVTKSIIDDTLKGRDMLLSILEQSYSADELGILMEQLTVRYGCSTEKTTNDAKKLDSSRGTTTRVYWITFSPGSEIFERGLNPERLLDELNASGKTRIIVHEGDLSWEKQKKSKLCQTSWEVFLHTTLGVDQVEEIFMFYDQDEYRIFDLSIHDPEKEPFVLQYLQRYYKTGKLRARHFGQVLEELTATDLVPENVEVVHEEPLKVDPGQSSHNSQKVIKEATINVSSHKLDELMNLVSELVISTASLDAYAGELQDPGLGNIIENIERLTKKFRSNALDLRLIPVGNLLGKFNRQVRDLSISLNKDVALILEGHETEIDKTILRSIESPLMHIVRNSLDHGIESPEERRQKGKSSRGMLKITAFYSGANVIIQVQDDGRGINLDRIRETAVLKGYITADQRVSDQELLGLIMEPGFTTAENVSLVSGRGVGMDVVKKELTAIGGSLEIDTEKDLGTSITLKLPTTLSIIDTLELEVSGTQFLVPLLEVEYCYKESRKNLYFRNDPYLQYKNEMVPFISLREKFRYPETCHQQEMVVILSKYEKRYAIVVDDIIGEHQTVIKPLGELFVNQPYFSGGSIMANGNLALVLDASYLFNQPVIK